MRNKNIVDFFRIFCLSFCFLFIGFFFVLLCSFFYEFLFHIFGVYYFEFSREFILRAIDNLILFFLHYSELSLEFWNSKEILHFVDVRNIFDFFILIFVCCVCFLIWFKFNLKILRKAVKWSFGIIFLPLFLFPIFSWFWVEVFHPLVFSNDLWMLFPEDLCYWIFPLEFFMGFYLIFILVEVLILFGVWFFSFKFKFSHK